MVTSTNTFFCFCWFCFPPLFCVRLLVFWYIEPDKRGGDERGGLEHLAEDGGRVHREHLRADRGLPPRHRHHREGRQRPRTALPHEGRHHGERVVLPFYCRNVFRIISYHSIKRIIYCHIISYHILPYHTIYQ